MHAGRIEETRVPKNPLDVLCQQIVAMCAERSMSVDELYALVSGAYPYRDLPRSQLEGVLDMLAGRYPSDEFAELRPRLVWDRVEGTVRARDGAGRVAIANAGTIPDRGLFGVFLADGGGRVGELDEEMVYEAREGQVFLLGASSWRIEEITRDRVIVSPAPGAPGAIPFWKGEEVGRPAELGGAIGAFCREIAAMPDERAVARLMAEHDCDERAARNVVAVPARAGGGHRRRALGPGAGGRAVPRRDRRLAAVPAVALRRAGARPLGAGARRAAAPRARASRPSRCGPTTGSSCTCRTPTPRRTPSS